MDQLVTVNSDATMSSLDFLNKIINPARTLAGESELRNTEMIRKIESECDDLGGLQIFSNPTGTDQKYYNLTMDQMMLVGMRESKSVRRTVLDKLKAMDQKTTSYPALPQTLPEALRLAADLAEKAIKLEAKIEEDAPKVEFVERYMAAPESFTFRQVAKKLRVKENFLREFLTENKIMYRLGGQWVAYANHVDAGRFIQVSGVADNDHAYTQSKFTTKGVEWLSEMLKK